MTRLTFCCHYDNHYDNDRHGLLLLALINLIRWKLFGEWGRIYN